MEELKYKVALVYDYGNFFEVAQRLAKDFGKVYYFCPKVIDGFPTHAPLDIGRNVDNVEVVKEWATIINNVDLVFFCDCHESDLQDDFRKRGKLVFGAGKSARLETDRPYFKEQLELLGLPCNEYEVVKGVEALDGLLKSEYWNDSYIKSGLRGDMETWHHQKYALSRGELIEMKNHMGVFHSEETYVVEKPIPCIAEIGIDTFVVNGAYPKLVLAGLEVKDCMYVCKVTPYNELPKQLRLITDRLGIVFSENEYRGWFSDEVIIGEDKKGYIIDATARLGQPPTSIMTELFTNFSECVLDVSRGRVPDIKYEYEWGVQLIIKSDIAETRPSPLIVPEQYKDRVKIKNLVIDEDGTWYYTPQGIKMKEIGAVIGYGHTLKEAINMATEVAESIEGFDTYIKMDSIDKAQSELNKLTKAGIKFI